MASEDHNPYQSSVTPDATGKTRALRPLVWTGVSLLLLAMICLAISVLMLIFSFNAISTSELAPIASEVATSISNASLPAFLSAPLGLVGIVLTIAGLVIRRPV